jgi:hypothetical protein
MKRMACNGIGLALLLSLFAAAAGAQNQSASNPAGTSQSSTSGNSLGDYARQIRKDPAPKSQPKVYDNDNLPTDDKLSIVGPPQTTADNSSAPKTDDAANAPASGSDGRSVTDAKPDAKAADAKAADAKAAEDKANQPPATLPEDDKAKQVAIQQWSDKISGEKGEISSTERELNILQREYQIRAAAMYGDVGNRLRNSADWDKQDAEYKQQIADKQKALDDARQKLSDSQEDARKAGVPESARGEQ